MLNTKLLGGVKVKHHKTTAHLPAEAMPIPDKVSIPMLQHLGPACEVKVQVGETVKVGQVIGDSTALFSAPIHASVSGTVTAIEDFTTSSGATCKRVVITADKQQELDPAIKKPEITDHKSFVAAIRASGLVGLGGAGFPTHVKLNPPDLSKIDTLLINGAECEPYITADHRTALDDSQNLLDGVAAVQKYLGIAKAIIAIEDNKADAIEKLRGMTADNSAVEVKALPAIYPQGAEKVTIYQSTGRIIPEGKLPSDVGVVVLNITTISVLGQYLKDGIPLITKTLTVDGGAIAKPKNVVAPIGASYKDVIAFCGGFSQEPGKILMGGPMMGIAIADEDLPVIKNNNALLVFDQKQAKGMEETPCIRCGRCTRACPVLLMPASMEGRFLNNDVEGLKKLKANLCIECGCCSYVCPAKRHLVARHRQAKQLLKNMK